MKLSQSFVSFDPLKSAPVSFCRSNITAFKAMFVFLPPVYALAFSRMFLLVWNFPGLILAQKWFFFSWKAITSERLNKYSWHSKNRRCVPLRQKNAKWPLCFSYSTGNNSLSLNQLGWNPKRPAGRAKGRLGRKRGKSVSTENIHAQRVSCFGCLFTFFTASAKGGRSKMCPAHPAQCKPRSSCGGFYPDWCKLGSKVKMTICISLRL